LTGEDSTRVEPTVHPPAETLASFLEGTLPPAGLGAVAGHLRDCAECRVVVSESAGFEREEEGAGAVYGEAQLTAAPYVESTAAPYVESATAPYVESATAPYVESATAPYVEPTGGRYSEPAFPRYSESTVAPRAESTVTPQPGSITTHPTESAAAPNSESTVAPRAELTAAPQPGPIATHHPRSAAAPPSDSAVAPRAELTAAPQPGPIAMHPPESAAAPLSDAAAAPRTASAVRFQRAESEPAAPRTRPVRWWWAAAAAIIALVATSLLLRRDGDPRAQLIAAAPHEHRRVEARLSGFPWARVQPPFRGAAALDPADLQLTGAAGDVLASAAPHHARGTALLLIGHFGEAVTELEAATAAHPEDAAAWSDLAAARDASAIAEGRKPLLPAALAAADQALVLDSRSPDALFNRAVILEHLGRRAEARTAFKRYLASDGVSPWAAEARERLARLAASW
jgi:hypothetical protein